MSVPVVDAAIGLLIAREQTELLHELEVEITPSSLLLSYAAYRGDESVGQRERDGFDELIRVFVNNARILVRNSGSWS